MLCKDYENNIINMDKIRCGISKLVNGQIGVFAKTNIKKVILLNWGLPE